MSGSVPLRLVAGPTASLRGLALQMPTLSGGSNVPVPTSDRTDRVVRATIAAAALAGPRRALHLVHLSKHDPSAGVLDELDDTTTAVIAEVTAAADGAAPSTVTPDDTHRVVGAAVGADPVLVKVASDAIALGDASPTLLWASSLDIALLEKAARAALRAKLLRLPTTKQSIDLVKKDITEMKERIAKLEHRKQGATSS